MQLGNTLFRDVVPTCCRWIIILLPTLLVAGLSIFISAKFEQTTEKTYLQAIAKSQADQIDLKLETYKAALLTIANSDALVRTGDLEVLRRESETVGKIFGGWFVLATAGEILEIEMLTGLDGTLPPPEPRTSYSEVVAAEQRAVQSGRPEVSDAFLGRATGETVVTLAMPVTAGEFPVRFLYMSFDTQHLSQLLSLQRLPEKMFTAIADGSRRVIARSSEIERFRLTPLPEWYVEASAGIDSAVFEGDPIPGAGERRLFAMQRLKSAPSWTLVVSSPVSRNAITGLNNVWPAIAAIGTFFLLFAVTGALIRHRQIESEKEAAEATAARTSALLNRVTMAEAGKSRLLGIVGHELRTPLVAQLGLLDLLEANSVNEEFAHWIERARHQGHDMLMLLDDLLEVSRLGVGEARLRKTAFDPVALSREITDLLTPIAARNGNMFELQIKSEPAQVLGDTSAVRRILLNFGTNAAKFTHDGKITVVFASHAMSDGSLDMTWSVVDTGIGIASSQIPKLFEEFGRPDNSHQTEASGAGLGLAICKGLANAMGGAVWAESVLGSGSTFFFRVALPMTIEPLGAASTESDGSVDLSGTRILLVEDQELIRLMTARQLLDAGAEVETAIDGLDAIAKSDVNQFDLILMDLRMPKLDGFAAAKRIRTSRGLNVTTPIIGLTAHQTTEVAAKLSDGAIDKCLFKPLDLKKLSEVFSLGNFGPAAKEDERDQVNALMKWDTLDWLTDSDPASALDMVVGFLRECEDAISNVIEALDTGNLTGAGDFAHKLSGLAKVIGAVGLAHELDALEDSTRAGDAARAERGRNKILILSEETRNVLEQWCSAA